MKPCVANYGKSVSMLKIPFQASQLLKKLYFRHMVRKYVRGIAPQRKAQVQRGQQSTPELKFILEIDVLKNLF